jgi:membrane-bound ClpP family serine protease
MPENKEIPLFKAFFTAGALIFVFGAAFVIIDVIVNSFTEGLRFLGINFMIAGAITIIISYLIKYYKMIGFLIGQIKNKISKQDKFSEWHKP